MHAFQVWTGQQRPRHWRPSVTVLRACSEPPGWLRTAGRRRHSEQRWGAPQEAGCLILSDATYVGQQLKQNHGFVSRLGGHFRPPQSHQSHTHEEQALAQLGQEVCGKGGQAPSRKRVGTDGGRRLCPSTAARHPKSWSLGDGGGGFRMLEQGRQVPVHANT